MYASCISLLQHLLELNCLAEPDDRCCLMRALDLALFGGISHRIDSVGIIENWR